MSSVLHQHIVKVVREEKERSMEEFTKALESVRRAGLDEEVNKVYLAGTAHGSGTATGDLTGTGERGEMVESFDEFDDADAANKAAVKSRKKKPGDKSGRNSGTKKR